MIGFRGGSHLKLLDIFSNLESEGMPSLAILDTYYLSFMPLSSTLAKRWGSSPWKLSNFFHQIWSLMIMHFLAILETYQRSCPYPVS